jgi:hypothetical protein
MSTRPATIRSATRRARRARVAKSRIWGTLVDVLAVTHFITTCGLGTNDGFAPEAVIRQLRADLCLRIDQPTDSLFSNESVPDSIFEPSTSFGEDFISPATPVAAERN